VVVRKLMTAAQTASGSRSVSARRAGGVRMSSYSSAGSPAKTADRVDAAYDIALGVCGVGLANVLQGFGIAQYGERLLKLSEILGTDDDRRITAVTGDDDSLVLVFDAIDDFR
jgi:hypothetical protein